jgi:hypothetical protein
MVIPSIHQFHGSFPNYHLIVHLPKNHPGFVIRNRDDTVVLDEDIHLAAQGLLAWAKKRRP